MQPRTRTLATAVLIIGLAACTASDDTPTSTGGTETSQPAAEQAAPDDTMPDPAVEDTTPSPTVEDPVAEGIAVFDPSVLHTIEVQFAEDDYDAMIATYQETGDKDWIEATVTIDGTTFERVGLRLKGNSSLAGLGGAGGIGGFPGRGVTDTSDSTPAPDSRRHRARAPLEVWPSSAVPRRTHPRTSRG